MTARILHVDDTPAALYARTRLLQRGGYEVVQAASGREALEKIAEGGASLMLLDVHLPDISGFEVCEQVKRHPDTRSMPVVQISAARVTDLDAAFALSSGADFYLTEPVCEESLLLVVKSLLERRRLQQQAERAKAREVLENARAAGVVQDDALATLGHELREPLQAMAAWLRVLRDRRAPEQERAHALDQVQRALNRQTGIVSDLLDIARIGSGRLSGEFAPMSLEQVLLAAVDEMQRAIVEKNIRLCIVSDGPVWIAGDAVRIAQMVRHLLANAIRFAAVGGSVQITCERAGSEAVLQVEDDGPGIAAGVLPHLFEPLRPAERNDTRPQAGLGLGLAVAAHVVHEHGGRISVVSTGHAAGATFTVRLSAITPR
jgi:signal transduction histidine kinase